MRKISLKLYCASVLGCMAIVAYAETTPIDCGATVDSCFSYTHTCEAAVVQLIQSAQKRIWLAGYGFTSPAIAEAIQAAHARGVQVHLVPDRSNTSSKYSQAPHLAEAGVDIRINWRYAIMHHKLLIVDEAVGFGSMNFTQAANKRNAENFNIFREAPSLARLYEIEFLRLYKESERYCPAMPRGRCHSR
jgi:phosphatidylserine/phosphatidylglycerophosphate/cardiolipin synthase-like enzyme